MGDAMSMRAGASCVLAVLACVAVFMVMDGELEAVVHEAAAPEANAAVNAPKTTPKAPKVRKYAQVAHAKLDAFSKMEVVEAKAQAANPSAFQAAHKKCSVLRRDAALKCGAKVCAVMAGCGKPCPKEYGQPPEQIVPLSGSEPIFHVTYEVGNKERHAKELRTKERTSKELGVKEKAAKQKHFNHNVWDEKVAKKKISEDGLIKERTLKEATLNKQSSQIAKLVNQAKTATIQDDAKCKAAGLTALQSCEKAAAKESKAKAKEKEKKLDEAKKASEKTVKLAEQAREETAYASAETFAAAEAKTAEAKASETAYTSTVQVVPEEENTVASYGETQAKCLKLNAADCITTLGCQLDSDTNKCIEGVLVGSNPLIPSPTTPQAVASETADETVDERIAAAEAVTAPGLAPGLATDSTAPDAASAVTAAGPAALSSGTGIVNADEAPAGRRLLARSGAMTAWKEAFEMKNCKVETDVGKAATDDGFQKGSLLRYLVTDKTYAVYKRLTDVPATLSMYNLMTTTWSVKKGNLFNIDFSLYSTEKDAEDGTNAWKFCNGDDAGVGFPRDCGPNGGVPNKWMASNKIRFPCGQSKTVSFWVKNPAEEPEHPPTPLMYHEHAMAAMSTGPTKKVTAAQESAVAKVQTKLTAAVGHIDSAKTAHQMNTQMAGAVDADANQFDQGVESATKQVKDAKTVLSAWPYTSSGKPTPDTYVYSSSPGGSDVTSQCKILQEGAVHKCRQSAATVRVKKEKAWLKKALAAATAFNTTAATATTEEEGWVKQSKTLRKTLKQAVAKAVKAVEAAIRKGNVTMDPGDVGYVPIDMQSQGSLANYVDTANKGDEPKACDKPKAGAFKECGAWLDTAYETCNAMFTKILGSTAVTVVTKTAQAKAEVKAEVAAQAAKYEKQEAAAASKTTKVPAAAASATTQASPAVVEQKHVIATSYGAWAPAFEQKNCKVDLDDGKATTDKDFKQWSLVKYVVNGQVYAVYKRMTKVPADFSIYDLMTDTWSVKKGNLFNIDFSLYSTEKDAEDGTNAWKFCNGDDAGVGFPRDCGPNGGVPNKWMARSIRFPCGQSKTVSFWLKNPNA